MISNEGKQNINFISQTRNRNFRYPLNPDDLRLIATGVIKLKPDEFDIIQTDHDANTKYNIQSCIERFHNSTTTQMLIFFYSQQNSVWFVTAIVKQKSTTLALYANSNDRSITVIVSLLQQFITNVHNVFPKETTDYCNSGFYALLYGKCILDKFKETRSLIVNTYRAAIRDLAITPFYHWRLIAASIIERYFK